MKFKTRVWKRTPKSFAVTTPGVTLVHVDLTLKNKVLWEYNKKLQKWTISLISDQESKQLKKSASQVLTSLWKRSQRTHATTIPHAVLLQIDASKEYDVAWQFDPTLNKWVIDLEEVGGGAP